MVYARDFTDTSFAAGFVASRSENPTNLEWCWPPSSHRYFVTTSKEKKDSRGNRYKQSLAVSEFGWWVRDSWDKDLNLPLTPYDVSPMSNRVVWVLCLDCKMPHQQMICTLSRGSKHVCDSCAKPNHSAIEFIFYSRFKRFLEYPALGETVPLRWRHNSVCEVDILGVLNGVDVVIEYDGGLWHDMEGAYERDVDKSLALLKAGYLVVRIRNRTLPTLEIIDENYFEIKQVDKYNNPTQVTEDVKRWLRARAKVIKAYGISRQRPPFFAHRELKVPLKTYSEAPDGCDFVTPTQFDYWVDDNS